MTFRHVKEVPVPIGVCLHEARAAHGLASERWFRQGTISRIPLGQGKIHRRANHKTSKPCRPAMCGCKCALGLS